MPKMPATVGHVIPKTRMVKSKLTPAGLVGVIAVTVTVKLPQEGVPDMVQMPLSSQENDMPGGSPVTLMDVTMPETTTDMLWATSAHRLTTVFASGGSKQTNVSWARAMQAFEDSISASACVEPRIVCAGIEAALLEEWSGQKAMQFDSVFQ